MARASRFLWSCVAAGLALAGCSKGGDGRPAPTCARWTPGAGAGPGDAEGYFPLAVGDRWTFTSALSPGAAAALQVTGTRSVLGWSAAVLVQSDLETAARSADTYRAVDEHGVVELGNADASDTLTRSLVPYYVARFPVTAGDAFTSVDCTNLDLGEDLDGDGKNELLDVRVAVSVPAIEPVETPIASFPGAARVEQRLTVTVRATGSPQQVTQEGLLVDWFVAGVGPVREVVEEPLGSPQPASELMGWAVGDATRGLLARRTIATGFAGPFAAVGRGDGRLLLAGTRVSPSGGSAVRLGGVWLAPDGSAGAPFDLFAVDAQPIDVSPPALAAAGGVVAAVAARCEPGAGEVLLQRLGAAGELLEPAGGRSIGAASVYARERPPAIATDGTGFLVAWAAEGPQYPDPMLRAVRVGADGAVLGETHIEETFGATFPRSAVAAFDGTRYLVVYESIIQTSLPTTTVELHAVHLDAAGVVAEAAPIVLSATPGAKQPVGMLFDGAQHLLLLVDGRDGAGNALVLRRLSPSAEWLDGDAATGGVVLAPAMNAEGPWQGYAASLALAGTTPVVAWTTGKPIGEPDAVIEELWVTRIGADGAPLDLHGGAPGVDAYLGDPAACFGPSSPLTLGGADGLPEVLYSASCRWPEPPPQALRGVRFGL